MPKGEGFPLHPSFFPKIWKSKNELKNIKIVNKIKPSKLFAFSQLQFM